MLKYIQKIFYILFMILCANMLFSKFFEFRVSILPLLLFFLLLNIVCKMNLAFEIGLFIAGIIIIRPLCYGTFIFDYKEVSMGILFGRYSQIVNKILILALVVAVVIIISKYKIRMACKKNYFISIIFSLCAGFILYSIRPAVFNLVIQHQNYGSEIYMFNSLYFYYYFILFLTAILIPVNLISRMIYLEIKYQ